MKKENKIPRKLKKGLSWSAKYAILFDRIFMGGRIATQNGNAKASGQLWPNLSFGCNNY